MLLLHSSIKHDAILAVIKKPRTLAGVRVFNLRRDVSDVSDVTPNNRRMDN